MFKWSKPPPKIHDISLQDIRQKIPKVYPKIWGLCLIEMSKGYVFKSYILADAHTGNKVVLIHRYAKNKNCFVVFELFDLFEDDELTIDL